MALNRGMADLLDTLDKRIEQLGKIANVTTEVVEESRDFHRLVAKVSFLELEHWEDASGPRQVWRRMWGEKSVVGEIAATQKRLADALSALSTLHLPAEAKTRMDHESHMALGSALTEIDAACDKLLAQMQGANEYIEKKGGKEQVTRRAFLQTQIQQGQQTLQAHQNLYARAKGLEKYQVELVASNTLIARGLVAQRRRPGYGAVVQPTVTTAPLPTDGGRHSINSEADRPSIDERRTLLEHENQEQPPAGCMARLFCCFRKESTEERQPKEHKFGRVPTGYSRI